MRGVCVGVSVLLGKTTLSKYGKGRTKACFHGASIA